MEKRQVAVIICLTIIITISVVNCKKADTGNDISAGSWGVFLQTESQNVGLVYAFRGAPENGTVYYKNQNRGKYWVDGDTTVTFKVNHYDSNGLQYIYSYRGVFRHYYKMEGTFTITDPRGNVSGGTWSAER